MGLSIGEGRRIRITSKIGEKLHSFRQNNLIYASYAQQPYVFPVGFIGTNRFQRQRNLCLFQVFVLLRVFMLNARSRVYRRRKKIRMVEN